MTMEEAAYFLSCLAPGSSIFSLLLFGPDQTWILYQLHCYFRRPEECPMTSHDLPRTSDRLRSTCPAEQMSLPRGRGLRLEAEKLQKQD